MKNSDFEIFAAVIRGLADNFSAEVTADGLEFRFECLKKYSIEQIKAAALAVVRTRKYTKMPTVADFIEAIEGNTDDRAEQEAMLVLAEIRRIGSYQTPAFADTKTRQIVSHMGWGNLCQMKEIESRFFVKDFIESYRAEARRQDTATISAGVEHDVKRLLDGIAKEVEA